MPQISVIMGIYNCADTLEEAVDCIINQSFTDWELIMCDDFSSDNTYEIALKIAEKDSRIIVIKNEKNLTLAPTLNRCIDIAKGEYIARMDGDDVCDITRFEKELDFLENNPQYAIVSSLMNLYDKCGVYRTIMYREKPSKESFIKGSQFCHAGCMMRTEAIKAIVHTPGTVYLRLGRGGEKRIHDKIEDFQIGKAVKIQNAKAECEKKVALFSTGAILDEATDAAKMLEEAGIGVEEYSFHTVKPIDKDIILDCAKRYDYIVTVEEHNIVGGFASAVSEVITDSDEKAKLIKIGLNDEYCSKVGNQKYLRAQYGMTAQDIVKKVKETVR